MPTIRQVLEAHYIDHHDRDEGPLTPAQLDETIVRAVMIPAVGRVFIAQTVAFVALRSEGGYLVGPMADSDIRTFIVMAANDGIDIDTGIDGFAQDLSELMRAWDETYAAARARHPNASDETVYQIAAGAMNRSLGLTVE